MVMHCRLAIYHVRAGIGNHGALEDHAGNGASHQSKSDSTSSGLSFKPASVLWWLKVKRSLRKDLSKVRATQAASLQA